MCNWGTEVGLIVTIPAHLSHTGVDRQDVKGIDSCIAPIVKALNDGGITTISSCCGHGKGTGVIMLADGRELEITSIAIDGGRNKVDQINEDKNLGDAVVDRETEQGYRVIHLYDMDYMVDEAYLVVLQADRAPSVEDMKSVASRFNELRAWRALRDEIVDAVKLLAHPKFTTDEAGHIQYYVTKSDVAMARALLPKLEATESAKRPISDRGTDGQA
jgi:hypothetical protein